MKLTTRTATPKLITSRPIKLSKKFSFAKMMKGPNRYTQCFKNQFEPVGQIGWTGKQKNKKFN